MRTLFKRPKRQLDQSTKKEDLSRKKQCDILQRVAFAVVVVVVAVVVCSDFVCLFLCWFWGVFAFFSWFFFFSYFELQYIF